MQADKIYSVYAIRHVATGKYYFAQTSGSVSDRWEAHVHDGLSAKPRTGMAKAIAEYGPEAFAVVPMLTNLTKSAADEWERRMVEQYDARGTFNFMFTQAARKACGDRKRGGKASAETRAKMSAAHKVRWAAVPADERRAVLNRLGRDGANARRGLRRIKLDGKIQYVPWKPDEDPIEVQRERWRLKARKARERKAALKAGAR